MIDQRKKAHLSYWISGGLFSSFIISLYGSFLPYESVAQTLLFKIDNLCAISAFACLGAKATTEGHDLAGAGFTVLAISQGLFLSHLNEPGHWNDESAVTAIFFLIPSFILISYYPKFPRWLHIAGIISTVPFLAAVIFYYSARYNPNPLFRHIIYLIYQFVTLCWGWFIWKERKINK